MTKLMITGMIVLTTVATNVTYATPAKAPREILVEYTRVAKDAMFGKGGTAQGLNEAAFNQVKRNLVKELALPGKEASLNVALSGAAGRARMESLVTIIAAKKMSVELAKTNATEAQSISAASDATAKLIANAMLLGAVKDSAISMKTEELSLMRESLTKLETISPDILVRFSKAERDSYTLVLERLDTMVESGAKKSYEELFIDSIMAVKKIDRIKALEIVKKLKECV